MSQCKIPETYLRMLCKLMWFVIHYLTTTRTAHTYAMCVQLNFNTTIRVTWICIRSSQYNTTLKYTLWRHMSFSHVQKNNLGPPWINRDDMSVLRFWPLVWAMHFTYPSYAYVHGHHTRKWLTHIHHYCTIHFLPLNSTSHTAVDGALFVYAMLVYTIPHTRHYIVTINEFEPSPHITCTE